jgi:S-adenosylmethionine:diacylglycerol 3-amino-3-carboxypropyl transferase
MGYIKDKLKELISSIKEKKNKEKELEDEYYVQKRVQDRLKSREEVELEGYVEKDRQEKIKNMLKRYRYRQKEEFIRGNNLRKINNPNLFKDGNLYRAGKIFKQKRL